MNPACGRFTEDILTGKARLSCSCGGTVVPQPNMTPGEWGDARRAFKVRHAGPKLTVAELEVTLTESVQLQAFYAKLLNQHDGGERIVFSSVEAWVARLRETGKLPKKTTPP